MRFHFGRETEFFMFWIGVKRRSFNLNVSVLWLGFFFSVYRDDIPEPDFLPYHNLGCACKGVDDNCGDMK